MMSFDLLPESYMPTWVIEGVLAKAQRPGYPVNKPNLEKIEAWAEAVLNMGIRSIICILDHPQLAHYYAINLNPDGLFGYYRSLGLDVTHVPAEDYKDPKLSKDELEQTSQAYQLMDKPILIHCSAGKDRTGAAIEHILNQLT